MKLSLVFATVGIVAVSAGCSSQDRAEGRRATATTTITSAPVVSPPSVTTAATEPATPAVAPQAPVTPPARDVTPAAAPQATAAATATTATTSTAAAVTATKASAASTARSARKNSDLVERGQLVGPSLAPQQPIVIFPSSQQGSATSSPGFGRPTESPSDFSPKPRDAAPSMGGQITSFTGSAPTFGSSSSTSRGF